MKRCPHCEKEISLVQFVMKYGTDTLISEPGVKGSRIRQEHRCIFCHEKIWIKYRPLKLRLVFRKYLGFLLVPVVGGWFLGNFVFHLSGQQTVGLIGVLIFLSLPPYLAYAKYETVELKSAA